MTHDDLIGSAAAYALDALDGEERAAFERHLRGCAQCQDEVASFHSVSSELAFSAPSVVVTGRDETRERLVERAKPVRPISAHRTFPLAPWLAAAACLVAAVLSATASRNAKAERAELARELAAARAQLARNDSALSAFFGPEVHVVSLTAPKQAKPALRVFWNHTRNTFIVTAHALPPAPAGKTYQLWAISKGKAPVSMGTFNADANGRALALLPVSSNVVESGFIDDCALTVEPAGGSPQPTETPRLIGAWRHVD